MLKIRNLQVKIKEKIILDNINIDIKKKTINIIMGPNGSGKSSLSHVIAGNPFYKISKGEILFNNENINNLNSEERAKLGIFLSFQNPVEIPGISNIEFLKTIYTTNNNNNINTFSFIKKLKLLCKKLDINFDLLKRSINYNFSGGEKKKNEILQMHLLNPKIALLDEIDSGLDIDALKIIFSSINELIDKNLISSIIIISHNEKIINYINPDYIHILHNGTFIKTGNKDILQNIKKYGYKNLK